MTSKFSLLLHKSSLYQEWLMQWQNNSLTLA